MPLLLADIDAFYLEHRRCGKLKAEVYEGEPAWVVMECSCGEHLGRAERDYTPSVFAASRPYPGGFRLPAFGFLSRKHQARAS